MEKRGVLTKMLGVAGTVLVWFPILAPVLLTVAVVIVEREFLFDYLMPAELFLFVPVGSGLLIWAALRAGASWKRIGWGLLAAAALLVSVQGLAVVTGLASGETAVGGWQWVLVLALLAAYCLALLAIGVGSLQLLRRLFAPIQPPAA
ncbi:MAG: hypothetical protein H6666_08545 [Ardenticatenaceae bacterium]|nr:hypothetical protein [Ardenticatenaceae bacterium]